MSDEARPPLVAVIILNWNGVADTIACLTSVASSTHPNLLTIVVDNDSTDDSARQLRAWRDAGARREPPPERLGGMEATDYEWTQRHGLCPKQTGTRNHSFIMVENEQNLGFAAGCNVGIRLALALNADFIWLLNNDTEVDSRCLEKQLQLLQSEKSIDCTVPVMLVHDSGGTVWNCGGRLLPGGLRRYFMRAYAQ